MRTKFITEPVFETYVRLMYDCSLDEVSRYVEKEFSHKITVKDSTYGKLIVLDDKDEVILWAKDNNMFEVIHETIHLVFFWMRFKEIPIEKSTEEVFAHLQGFYIGEIKKMFDKKKK